MLADSLIRAIPRTGISITRPVAADGLGVSSGTRCQNYLMRAGAIAVAVLLLHGRGQRPFAYIERGAYARNSDTTFGLGAP